MLKQAFFAASILIAAPAMAQSPAAPKPAADIRIVHSRIAPTSADGGDYVELAQAYLRAGRTGDAAVAYRAALARDNVMMVTRHGDSIWSHEIARGALAMMPQLASR